MAKSEKKQFLKRIKITNDLKVELYFTERATTNTVDDQNNEKFVTNEYSAKTNYVPHDDLINAMRVLRKHGLKLAELKADTNEAKSYMVNEISLNGTLEEKNARLSMVLMKKLKRTKKPMAMKIEEVALFDPSEYAQCDDLMKLVKDVIKEVFLYLGGKHLGEEQLSIFQ